MVEGEQLLALLLVVFTLRLVVAVAAPVIDQETYHWAYAMSPHLSYFDHPPLVGWSIWAGVILVGTNPLGIRLMTLVFALITTVVGLALIRDFGRGRRGPPSGYRGEDRLDLGLQKLLSPGRGIGEGRRSDRVWRGESGRPRADHPDSGRDDPIAVMSVSAREQ